MFEGLFINLSEVTKWRIRNLEFKKIIIFKIIRFSNLYSNTLNFVSKVTLRLINRLLSSQQRLLIFQFSVNGRRSLFTGTELSMQYFGGDSRKIKHLAPYWPLKRISMKGYCSTWTFFFSWWWSIIHSVWRWPLPVRGNIDLQLVLYWRFFHFLEK